MAVDEAQAPSAPRVLCIGNFVIDTIVRAVDRLPAPGELALVDAITVAGGGAGFATSVALARLGARVVAVGAVGADDGGTRIRAWLEREGVDAAAVVTVAMPTSATVCLVASDGERTYLHLPGASRALRVGPELADLSGLAAVHVGAALLLDGIDVDDGLVRLLGAAREHRVQTTLDPSFDRSGHWRRLERYLPHLDVFAPSLVEALEVTGQRSAEDSARWIRDHGAAAAVLHAGGRGAYVASPEYTGWLPAIEVDVVDTVGAGECFDAGLVFGLANRWPMVDAVRLGCATGALAVTAAGAVGGLASLDTALRLARSPSTSALGESARHGR